MRKLIFPKLFDWQKEVFDGFEPTGKTAVVLSPRQSGKSFLCLAKLLQVAAQKAGSVSLVVEPTLNQSRKMFNDFMKILGDSGIIEKANESLLHIRFINKSEILFKSAEQKVGLRGYTVSGILVIDECAFITQDVIDDLLPTTTVHKASILICSTPLIADGYFYRMFSSDDTPTKRSFNGSLGDRSALISAEQIAAYKRTYSKQKFTTEILGEFLSNDGALFRNIEACLSIDEPEAGDENLYFGIDGGSGNGQDYTAVVCISHTGKMIFIDYFNDKTPTAQVSHISSLIRKYHPIKVTVESNSIGNIYYDMLQKAAQVPIVRFTTTNESKNRIIDKLGVALENEQITLLRDTELLTELRMYSAETTRTGKITYNAPAGYKDDLVMSTAICGDSIFSNKGNYQISVL